MLTNPDSGWKLRGKLIWLIVSVLPLVECGGGTFSTSNAPSAQQQLSPQISVSPASLSFGNVIVGSSNSEPIVVTNSGTGGLTITQTNVTGTGFSMSGLSLPLTLPSQGIVSFNAVFSPEVTGSSAGAIELVSDANNSPTNISLSGEGVEPHSVSLSWLASATPNIVGYNIYRGTQSGGPYTRLNPSIVTATNYTDTTPQAGQTYYYVVTAVGSNGLESAYSNQAQAVIPSP
jgi:hypothetical protein